MLLALDIGNTKIALGVYRDGRWAADWRIATHLDHLADEYAMLLKSLLEDVGLGLRDLTGTVIGSVVPPMTAVFQELSDRYVGKPAVVLGPGIKTGVEIRIDNPAETGADRIANTAAAHTLYGGPAIVIDLGTATTFDVVSDKGEYLGGAIAPGLGIAAEALVRRTSRLPKVELVYPPHAIGRNTVAAMQSGLVVGYVGLVKELVGCLRKELESLQPDKSSSVPPKIIATGGMAPLIARWAPVIDIVNPRLTLEGLRIIYELNRT